MAELTGEGENVDVRVPTGADVPPETAGGFPGAKGAEQVECAYDESSIRVLEGI